MDMCNIVVLDGVDLDDEMFSRDCFVINAKADSFSSNSAEEIFLAGLQPHTLPLEEVSVGFENPHSEDISE